MQYCLQKKNYFILFLFEREWSSRRSIAPMSYDEYEDYIPQKSSGNRSKSRRKKYEQNSSKRSISCTSLRRNRKHSGHRSSRHSHRHRFTPLIYFKSLHCPNCGFNRNLPDSGVNRNVPDLGVNRNLPDSGVNRNVPDSGINRNHSLLLISLKPVERKMNVNYLYTLS